MVYAPYNTLVYMAHIIWGNRCEIGVLCCLLKAEHISSLLDSNNELSLELAQNNQTIRKLETENDSLKAGFSNTSIIKPLLQRIKNQKSQYDTQFRGNEYALVLSDSEIELIQSSRLPSEDDIKTEEDVEKMLKHMTRANFILSKLRAKCLYHYHITVLL